MNKFLKEGLKLSYLLILIVGFIACSDDKISPENIVKEEIKENEDPNDAPSEEEDGNPITSEEDSVTNNDIFIESGEPRIEPSPLPGIYISGTTDTEGSSYTATYWKDGVAHYLDNSSYGYGMDVYGKNVYVAGESGISATYWKNDSIVYLPSDGNTAWARDIDVSEGDIYVLGSISDGGGYSYAVYWKNGIRTYLTEGSTYSQALSIIVQNGDVYVTGNIYMNGKSYAAYWKNGVITILGSGVSSACGYSIDVNGNDVFVAGYSSLGNGQYEKAKYWKNQSEISLTDGSLYGEVNALTINNGDVYVVGLSEGLQNGNGRVTFWKNDEIMFYGQDASRDVNPNSIAVNDGNVYGVGSVLIFGENGSFSSNATIWVNGVPSVLDGGYGETGGYSWAFEIKVVSQQSPK